MTKWLILLLTGTAMFSHAANLQQQLILCSTISQTDARLQCFDAIASSLTKQSATALETSNGQPETPLTAIIEHSAAPIQSIETVTTQANLPKSVVPASATQVDAFGASHLEQAATQELTEVEFVIASASQSKLGKWQVEFENGQIWQQKDSAYAKFSVGDSVVIKKGMFNAFYLAKKDVNRKIAVKRLK
jgi:5-hydroxyisourate hydrolase-like protein (transthyretin family)